METTNERRRAEDAVDLLFMVCVSLSLRVRRSEKNSLSSSPDHSQSAVQFAGAVRQMGGTFRVLDKEEEEKGEGKSFNKHLPLKARRDRLFIQGLDRRFVFVNSD